jgi:hypothetical protein
MPGQRDLLALRVGVAVALVIGFAGATGRATQAPAGPAIARPKVPKSLRLSVLFDKLETGKTILIRTAEYDFISNATLKKAPPYHE